MQRTGITQSAGWLLAAALAFATLLAALLALTDPTAGHRYTELPDPAMRVGLPPGYDYCANELSPPYYLICDRRREAEFSAANTSRYIVLVFDADASSALGYDATHRIESARSGILAGYRPPVSSDETGQPTAPSLEVTSLSVDGHEALEFATADTVSVRETQPRQRFIVIGLEDGRLVEVFNLPYGPISPSLDDLNFREIVRGIKFHD